MDTINIIDWIIKIILIGFFIYLAMILPEYKRLWEKCDAKAMCILNPSLDMCKFQKYDNSTIININLTK
jgi:hypothetical protein